MPATLTITEPANDQVFFQDDLITLRATADDFEDGDLSRRIQWTSDLDGVLGRGPAPSRRARCASALT